MPYAPPSGEALIRDRIDAIARRQVAEAKSLFGSFINSRRDASRSGPTPRRASANAHRDQRSLDDLRVECQHLVRNDPAAAAFCDRKAQLVAGEIQHIACDSGDPDFDARAVDRFCAWMDDTSGLGCDLTGSMTGAELVAAQVRHLVHDGDLLYVFVDRGYGVRSVQVVESMLVRNPGGRPDGPAPDRYGRGYEMVGGHVVGPYGDTAGYLVSRWAYGGSVIEDREPEFVHASDALWVASPHGRRVGQKRAEPQMASCIDVLIDLHVYVDALQQAAKAAAMLAILLKQERSIDPAQALGLEATPAESSASGDRELRLVSGMMEPLPPGTEPFMIDPKQPNTQFESFYWTRLQTVAARLAVPLELSHYRFIRNYSAHRSAVVAAFLALRAEQELVRRTLRRFWEFEIGGAIADGLLRPPRGPRRSDPAAWRRVTFTLPQPPALDINAEIGSRVHAIEAGLLSRREAARQLGFPGYAETVSQRGKDLEEERRVLGVSGGEGSGG